MDFKPREYKKITFRSRFGTVVVTALTASIATETLAPLFGMQDECDAIATALCVTPALEPWNHHTTERDFVNEPPAASYGYIASGAVNSMTPNSFTPGSTFLLAGDGNEIDLTT